MTTNYMFPAVVITPTSDVTEPDGSLAHPRVYYLGANQGGTFPFGQSPGAFAAAAAHASIKMHVRGGSTRTNLKHQYSVKVKGTTSDDNPFMQMPYGGKDWVFNAPGVVDLTYIRNVLTFSLQNAMGQWAPRTKYFEMFQAPEVTVASWKNVDDYFNQVLSLVENSPATYYFGLYINFEHINHEPNRVPLTSVDPKNGGTVPGFIMQLNGTVDTTKFVALNANGSPPLTQPVEIYIPERDYFAKHASYVTVCQNWYFEDASSGWASNFAALYPKPTGTLDFTAIRASTDYASFATYFLLNELAQDPDGYHRSTYMFKQPDNGTTPGVVFAGPLWDKNKSYGNPNVSYSVTGDNGQTVHYQAGDGWSYDFQSGAQSSVWWHVLLYDTQFCQQVYTLWQTYYATVLAPDSLRSAVTKTAATLVEVGAPARDIARWGWSNDDYATQVKALSKYLNAQTKWINANLAALLAAKSGFTPTP